MLASLHYSNSKETGHRISTTVIVSLSRICRLGCLMTLTSGVTAVCKWSTKLMTCWQKIASGSCGLSTLALSLLRMLLTWDSGCHLVLIIFYAWK